jgi:anthranilate phosphoribosyltransferase
MATTIQQTAVPLPRKHMNTLLERFFSKESPDLEVTSDEIAVAISYIFSNELHKFQMGSLLTCLHYSGWDRKAEVIAKCATVMRAAALQIDLKALEGVVKGRGKPEGEYCGGLVSANKQMDKDCWLTQL